ncbi:MAG: hypothetical protein B6D39_04745 [Anaerolineae bacterium UTCFX2]|nr:MAG: hypothetical protein B6D39_04745 [Anaerolineae bacterium UTCFX2]
MDLPNQSGFQSVIKARNLRMTNQRRQILQVLQESDEHLDAEAIYDRVRQKDARVSLATVYRSLTLFKNLGLVDERNLGEDYRRFETAQDEPHYHFTCLACRKVIEFNAPEIEQKIIPQIEAQGLKVTEAHLIVSGYCADCQRDQTRGKKHADTHLRIPNQTNLR